MSNIRNLVQGRKMGNPRAGCRLLNLTWAWTARLHGLCGERWNSFVRIPKAL
jgi:hypothetical protein